MSTIKVVNVQHPSAATAAITLDAAGGALIGGQAAYARNLLYNGAMQVAQRGTSATGITANGYNTADRWITWLSTLGTWTQSVESDGPTGSGLTKSLKMLCTTADAAPAASDQLSIRQLLEGQDVQRIAKGTSDAQQLSLSFWVKANVTGTYVVELFDSDNTRQVSESYTVSASATWEKKTITLPADTTGAFDNDNAGSLVLLWWLSAGSNFTSGTLNTTWDSSTNANRAVGQTNLAAATNNYWQVTGVQLEVGPVATPFEFKSYGQELRECLRYFWIAAGGSVGRGVSQSGTVARILVDFPSPMRIAPSTVAVSGSDIYIGDDVNYGLLVSSVSVNVSTPYSANIAATHASGASQYRPALFYAGGSGWFSVSAEL